MNKWIRELQKLDGALTDLNNPFENVLRTVSPSVNSIYGDSWGLPLGYTAVVYGPPKGGKTIYTHMVTGHLHMTDPEAIVVKFDSEYRSKMQLTPKAARMFGIDLGRIQPIQTNRPKDIFDQTEIKIAALCEKGAPIKLVIIDSLYGIMGRREGSSETVDQQIIGDHAATLGVGLKRLLDVQRKYNFSVILVDQVRSEMDKVEQMRGKKFKMRSSFAVQHHAEYFISCEKDRNKAGRSDSAGNEFVDDTNKDVAGKGAKTASKFKVKMEESSSGSCGRTGEYTLDFRHGPVNVHEEVFTLALNRGVIKHEPRTIPYEYRGESWKGEAAMMAALAESPDLQKKVIADLMALDAQGVPSPEDVFSDPDEDDES